MVHTRSQRHKFLSAKASRLRHRLLEIGIAKWHTNVYFGCSANESRLTLCTRTWMYLNPTSIWFIRKKEGCKDIVILTGCIHGLQKCAGCDADPNGDIKDDDVFARNRAWAVCKLWNCDPFVVGHEGADVEHCTLSEQPTRRLRLGNGPGNGTHALDQALACVVASGVALDPHTPAQSPRHVQPEDVKP